MLEQQHLAPVALETGRSVAQAVGGPKRPEVPATPERPGDQPAAVRAAEGGTTAPAPPARGRGLLLPLLGLLGLLALVCAAALPFAPVRHERPVVSWPQDSSAPESTSLVLSAQTPDALRVAANCAAVRAAGSSDDGVLFSTQRPPVAQAQQEALFWQVRDGRAVLSVVGEVVADVAVPATGDCEMVAELRDGSTTLTVDGAPQGQAVAGAPRLDSLATSVSAATADTGQQLQAQVAVDDRFASSPTPFKLVLVGLLVGSGLLLLGGVWLLDRRAHPVRAGPAGAAAAARTGEAPLPRWRHAFRPVTAHVVVVAGLALWTALAPMTDDDGYYAAMARNVPNSGYIGQYYQLYDQSFVPLTWPWYALSWWEQLGSGPVFLRIPAFLLCVATWFALRRALDLVLALVPAWRRGGEQAPTGGAKHRAVWLLALVYAAASAPFVMGVRPEGVVAALSAWTLVGVLTALRSRRLLPLALAVVLAAFSCASHPTGLVAIAPLVAFLPRTWALVAPGAAAGVSRSTGWLRALVVIAPGAMASAGGFADGTLFDYQEGRRVFTAIEEPLRWTDEYVRYSFLLNPNIPMGAYAKRTTVLVGLLAVLVTLLLTAAARRRGPGGAGAGVLPAELGALGATGLVAYLALWITPSKWTHHFGSLSGLLPLLVVVLVLIGPAAAARVWPRTALAPRLGLLLGVVVVAALSFRGPNLWPYNWVLGLPLQGDNAVAKGPLSSPALWVLVAVVAVALTALVLRRRRSAGSTDGDTGGSPGGAAGGADGGGGTPGALRPDALVAGAGATAVVALGLTVALLGGTFAASAVRTLDTYSPPAEYVSDPFNDRCDAASAVQVADPQRSTALPAAAGQEGRAQTEGFATQGGYWDGDPVPTGVAPEAFPQVWGSLTGSGDDNTGELTTGWYDLSGRDSADYVTVTVAGRLNEGNTLEVEYGRPGADGAVEVLRTREVDDLIDSPEWRSVMLLRPGQDARDGATLVRLVARDASGGTGGWLAVSAPVQQPPVLLEDWIPRDAVVVTSWQFTYLFSCQRQPAVANGIVERPAYAVLWGPNALEGTNDSIWQYGRGGLAAPLPDAATLFQPVSEFAYPSARRDAGQWGQVAELQYPYAADAYDLSFEPETSPGWVGPDVPALG